MYRIPPHGVTCDIEWNQEGTNENIVPKKHFLLVSFSVACDTVRRNTVDIVYLPSLDWS